MQSLVFLRSALLLTAASALTLALLPFVSTDSAHEQDYYYRAFCADTPVYNLWNPELLEGKWSLVRFTSPYTSNTLPLPTRCGSVTITPGPYNVTKTWTTSLKTTEGEVLTATKEATQTNGIISAGRWMVTDYGIFSEDEFVQEKVSSLMLLGYTSTEYPAYSTIMYASCTWVTMSMGVVINRLGEFGILVREGEEDLYDDEYFRIKYNRALEFASLGTVDSMTVVSQDSC
jgi:hypothetical protein